MAVLHVLPKISFIQLTIIIITTSILLYLQNYNWIIDLHANLNPVVLLLPLMTFANCSIAWRKQHQIASQLLNYTYYENSNGWYEISRIPKGTFSYWLLQENTQNLKNQKKKAYFADKFKVKHYIDQYKIKYPQFSAIHYAQILHDFDNGAPSFEKLKNLSETFHGFLLKPNHFSGKQVVVKWNETLTLSKYKMLMKKSRLWSHRKYKSIENKINREPWYELITPHIFIEENINNNPEKYILTEYKFHVFNYKALFCYIHQYAKEYGEKEVLNIYSLPDFKFLNVKWATIPNRSKIFPIPSKENLDIMIKFAQHFAEREQFRYVRLDLYGINDKIYFSEFTFSPNAGRGIIFPIEFNYLLYDILCDNKQEDIDKIYKYEKYDKELQQLWCEIKCKHDCNCTYYSNWSYYCNWTFFCNWTYFEWCFISYFNNTNNTIV
eukprot:305703_1